MTCKYSVMLRRRRGGSVTIGDARSILTFEPIAFHSSCIMADSI